MRFLSACIVSSLLAGSVIAQSPQYTTIGTVIRMDPQLDKLIAPGTTIEVVGSGFGHLEGPVWARDSSYLLVNDTKAQTTYSWSPTTGTAKFLEHTGYTGRLPYSEEPGTNGMSVDLQGRLIVCDHGDRRIARMPLVGHGGKETLSDTYQGKRYNSPNDVIVHPDGSIYFSDPSYGLPKKDRDPAREQPVNGVYRLPVDGSGPATLLIRDMTHPNGLALSMDGKTLFVSQSDSTKPIIMAYPILAGGKLGKGLVYFDMSKLPRLRYKEVPDGLKADKAGNLWASGPGGLLIIAPAGAGKPGKLIGRLDTGEVIANCAWGDDGSTLYIASGTYLCRIKTTTKGRIQGKLSL
ncbi:SMP-30/gluconolactonase/LRE family protein [Spirosoma rhododendri]|uniref:SMP-30/gluconolactonase/LRE family protein n=1 Tax=Spirosoma rhododendri TaxID=2728024 RepID=A0A7L5DY32_9BACT|nr:SMP-30/gluconolactonase/LRE family protein [Spirosoma rhododendri]QJD80440.1 SMP-30/gluconolactonase/LRE family protein [Spirosoma rhododendri]